jgi:hypothetical protein
MGGGGANPGTILDSFSVLMLIFEVNLFSKFIAKDDLHPP